MTLAFSQSRPAHRQGGRNNPGRRRRNGSRWLSAALAARLRQMEASGQAGVAERVMGVTQMGWPLAGVLSCRRRARAGRGQSNAEHRRATGR
jgi:hypothetical protein